VTTTQEFIKGPPRLRPGRQRSAYQRHRIMETEPRGRPLVGTKQGAVKKCMTRDFGRLFCFLRQTEAAIFAVTDSVERVALRLFLLAYFLYHLLHR